MQDEKEFERLRKQFAEELEEMAANAKSDALAMLAKIRKPDSNSDLALHQLLLVNEELKKRINFFSLLEIIKIVEGNTASRRASIRHAPGKIAKAFVLKEWEEHRTAYGNNKSEFARAYVRRVLNEYGFRVTEKQMREVWLKDPPPAGKPARLHADRQ